MVRIWPTAGLGLSLLLCTAGAACRRVAHTDVDPATNAAATELIDDITYSRCWQDGRVECFVWGPSCSSRAPEQRRDQELAEKLAALGPGALPAIEKALDSVNKKVEKSEYLLNADWLAYAYGLIRRSRRCSVGGWLHRVFSGGRQMD